MRAAAIASGTLSCEKSSPPAADGDAAAHPRERCRAARHQSPDPAATLKLAHRATWAAGDYPAVGRHIADHPVRDAITAAHVRPQARVLDVATGSGNVALPGRTSRWSGPRPELLDVAQARALAAGLEIEWVHGDAEAMPFEDGSFDSVTSVFGVQFTPRHQVTADELVRVCRPAARSDS